MDSMTLALYIIYADNLIITVAINSSVMNELELNNKRRIII